MAVILVVVAVAYTNLNAKMSLLQSANSRTNIKVS